MKPLHYYLVGTGSWFLSYGIQAVAFAWLVTIVLNESAKMVGVAQMAFLLPAMLLMLIGGSLADQLGGRRVAIIGHIAASIAPLFLTIVIATDNLSYAMVIVFAVIMGCAQALVTPARDGLLALVADGQIQQKVVLVSLVQFGVQMLGFLAAAFADKYGAEFILMLQFTILTIGTIAYFRLDVPHETPPRLADGMVTNVLHSIVEGYRTVKASRHMRIVVLQNCAMGVFFMGSYIVTIPLLIRDLYGGSSVELSWMNAGNSLGLVISILFLMRFGDIHRQGRALLVAQGIGAFALAGAGLGLGFYTAVGAIFAWGLCGGIAMTMSRTIMQEKAPPDQRARMMGFYSFSFMGSGPIGALFCGYLVEGIGPGPALMVASTMMLAVVVVVSFQSSLWSMDSSTT
ncbi:MAG: MFS transporter [bacterium]|nr:MFS transporter [Gammaproteobacteria bacterium]HIL99253.1 MFS transporter [Pseudomonadales bacterium]